MRRNGRQGRIAVVTGTRAEYGLLRTCMAAIDAHPRLHLQLIVTGMHLLRKFGCTVRQIETDGWRIDARVGMQRGDDASLDQAEGLSRGVRGIARYLQSAETDVVLVLGDRIEALAGALAAVTTGRKVAHLHGGDVAPGDFDDRLRNSITGLAHIHLAATRRSAARLRRLGAAGERIHVVGAPGLDELLRVRRSLPRPSREASSRGSGQAIVLQHAHGRRPQVEARVLRHIVRAVERHGLRSLLIHPNSDRGHEGVMREIRRLRSRRNGAMTCHASLPRDQFLRALCGARVLIGNSSSGIIESAAAGVPCVNVGARQHGRERAGRNVVDAGESYAQIHDALSRALRMRPKTAARTPYGDGRAGERVARVLASYAI